MRREVLFAILFGIGLGALVAFGLWRANLIFLPNKENPRSISEITSQKEQEREVTSDLIITQPEDTAVVSEGTITIKGSATPKATIVILTPEEEKILEANSDGSFEEKLAVGGGPNEIVVKSFDDQGKESTQKMTVVYSTELNADTK